MSIRNNECDEIQKISLLIGREIKTLEQHVRYRISAITPNNVRYDKVETSTKIYVPKRIFCNVRKDLSRAWIPVRPLKESTGTGYDGILKDYIKTMVSHIVAPTLVEIGLCEVKNDSGHWEIRLRNSQAIN